MAVDVATMMGSAHSQQGAAPEKSTKFADKDHSRPADAVPMI